MKTACFMMFKNEASILPAFLDQIKEFFDCSILVNHNSTDESARIVREFFDTHNNGALFHLKTRGLHQSECATLFGQQLFEQHNVDVICYLDADEFLPFETRADYEAFLYSEQKKSDIISTQWLNLAPEDYNPNRTLFDKRFYFCEIGFLPKVQVFKSLWEKDPQFIIDTGGHSVRSNCDSLTISKPENVFLYHIPIRSRAHFMMKMLNGHQSLLNAPDQIKNNQNNHILHYINQFDDVMKSDEIVAKFSMKYANTQDNSAVFIKKQLQFNFPYIQARPMDNVEHYIFDIACARYPSIVNISEENSEYNFILHNDAGEIVIQAQSETICGARFDMKIAGAITDFSLKTRILRKLRKIIQFMRQ